MPRISIPLYKRLYDDVKSKIINNEYKKNTKLESVRSLANRLDVSTTTVEKAYNQLLIEGYVYSKPRSGYIVENINQNKKQKNRNYVEPIEYNNFENTKLTEDLFDIKTYKSIVNKVINYESEKLFVECDPRGEKELREEIRKHVLKERNITCDINQIIIGPGIQSLLRLLHDIHPGKSVSHLTPKYNKAMSVFESYDYFIKGRKTINELTRLVSDYLYISPSNTYPSGDVIKVKERTKIIKWALDKESYIIEDDYNFFIRYNSYSVPSIFSMDTHNKVIYLGTFSKIIIPSIRISYMILPLPLYEKYKTMYSRFSQGVSKLDQLSLALFMKEGLFQRHIKKLYNKYKEKNELIVKAFKKQQKRKEFSILGSDSNLHVIIDFSKQKDLDSFTRNCERYYLKYEIINGSKKVIFPYSGIQNKDINSIVRDLFYSI